MILHRSAPIVLPKSDFHEIEEQTFGRGFRRGRETSGDPPPTMARFVYRGAAPQHDARAK